MEIQPYFPVYLLGCTRQIGYNAHDKLEIYSGLRSVSYVAPILLPRHNADVYRDLFQKPESSFHRHG